MRKIMLILLILSITSLDGVKVCAVNADPQREEQVKEKLQEILSSEEFSVSGSSNGFIESFVNMVKDAVEWIKDKLNSLNPLKDKNLMSGVPLSSNSVLFLRLISIVAVSIFILAITYFISRNIHMSRSNKYKEDETLLTTLKDPEQVKATALEFCKIGDFRQALRFLFISLLLKFNEINIIRIDKSKTNRQYMREIARSGYKMYDEVKLFNNAFNEHWYGNKNISAKDFDYWYQKIGRAHV